MIQRSQVVLSVLGELQDATENSGLDTLTRVALDVEQVLAPFKLPSSPCQDFPEWTGIDDTAHSLYPADAPAELLPLSCEGEGNLLFDAASMLLVGTPRLSLELQVRTVVEMLMWKRYYMCGMIDSKIMLQAARFSLCAEETEDMLNLPIAVLEAIFDADVKASCFPGSYANMWHVYALSSVLQCNIYSIYPMFNLKIRPYFNRLIRPRNCPKDPGPVTLHIMWSGDLQAGSVFKPDHFVALVQARGLKFGSPSSERGAPTSKSLDLPNQESQASYSCLKDKYNITKRTFYRWRRQSQEHCKKSTARYEAKHFLQACYLEGKLVSLHQFKEFFPDISRSTYYNWKHELMASGGTFSAASSAGEVSPGESTEQEAWSSPEAKQGEPERHDSVASLFGLNLGKLEGERAQNVVHMQEAKRCLQNCIAMNATLPFRIFKRKFPGISRSTYYNWRREAMLLSRGYKPVIGSSGDSSDADKSPENFTPKFLPSANQPTVTRVTACRRNHRSLRLAYVTRKQLRDAAKIHIQKSKWSLAKFKLKYPSMSSCLYWLWRRRHRPNNNNNKKKKVVGHVEKLHVPQSLDVRAVEAEAEMIDRGRVGPSVISFARGPATFSAPAVTPLDASKAPVDEHVFVLDVVALANFKAKAKLFLQQRFEEKSFPTFKEFRSYFPFTPRSTYYMWKRALHHGVSLVHG